METRHYAVVACALVVFFAAGCGSSDTKDDPGPVDTTQAGEVKADGTVTDEGRGTDDGRVAAPDTVDVPEPLPDVPAQELTPEDVKVEETTPTETTAADIALADNVAAEVAGEDAQAEADVAIADVQADTKEVPEEMAEEALPSGTEAEPGQETAIGIAVEVEDGETSVAQVHIPAGALEEATVVTVETAEAADLAPDKLAEGASAGPVVEFGPDGLQFKEPVRVLVPFVLPPGGTLDGVRVATRGDADEAPELLVPEKISESEGLVAVWVSHFCFFGAWYIGTMDCTLAPVFCDDKNPCTIDSCDEQTGLCGHAPLACDDEDPCTSDTCDAENGECTHEQIPGCPNDLKWYSTCGNPVCGMDDQVPPGVQPCQNGEKEGDDCDVEGANCDANLGCGAYLLCAESDPKQAPGGCPISKAKYKKEIRYLDEERAEEYRKELLGLKLATWRYRTTKGEDELRLGFIIDDHPTGVIVDEGRDQVDLYGYTSLAIATIQQQAKELESLKQEVKSLRRDLETCRE